MKILYLTLESYKEQPILKSQVLRLQHSIARQYSQKQGQIFFYLTTYDPVTINEINSLSIQHIPVKHRNYFISQFKLFRESYRLRKEYKIVHVRSYMPMFVACLLKILYKKKIIFDMRGVFPEEMYLRKKNRLLYLFFKTMEKVFCYISDSIVVVSRPFSEYISKEYPKQKGKVSDIPTFYCPKVSAVDDVTTESIPKIKEEIFKNPSVTILLYSGAFEKWQCVDKVIFLFNEVEKENPLARFAIFSHHDQGFKEYVETHATDPSKYYIAKIENKLLSRYVCQCDIGVLLRENSLINRVAAPIKFTDYLAGNLLVVISDGIGDSSFLVAKYKLGYTVPNLSLQTLAATARVVASYPNDLKANLDERIHNALNTISIDEISKQYLTLYNILNPTQ